MDIFEKVEEIMVEVKDKFQQIADEVQARLAGWKKNANLHEDLSEKDERINALVAEVNAWKEKFDKMWSAWFSLAKKTLGEEEAMKMAEDLKHNV